MCVFGLWVCSVGYEIKQDKFWNWNICPEENGLSDFTPACSYITNTSEQFNTLLRIVKYIGSSILYNNEHCRLYVLLAGFLVCLEYVDWVRGEFSLECTANKMTRHVGSSWLKPNANIVRTSILPAVSVVSLLCALWIDHQQELKQSQSCDQQPGSSQFITQNTKSN